MKISCVEEAEIGSSSLLWCSTKTLTAIFLFNKFNDIYEYKNFNLCLVIVYLQLVAVAAVGDENTLPKNKVKKLQDIGLEYP